MTSRIWSPSSRLLMIAGSMLALAGVVWLTWWLLGKTNGGDGAGIANVLALPVTVVGTAVAIWGLRARPYADDPDVLDRRASELLAAIVKSEARTLAQLMGDTGDPRPANVGFAQYEVIQSNWRSDGGTAVGSLETIADYYVSLRLGRLVVIGEPGAGKTVLATRLLLDLATPESSRLRIPVRLSLPAFSIPEGEFNAAKVRDQLDDWIADQLAATYHVEPEVTKALVAQKRVLPILDGLDEMDPDEGRATRARIVLDALNVAAGPGGWSVVVTCRAERYQEIARTGSALQDATVITMQPLFVEQAIGWLAHRFPDSSQSDGAQKRWHPVIALMRKHSIRGRLARCLTNPLMLYLAAAVYHDDQDPRELCDKGFEELRDHLLGQFIPAAVRYHSYSKGRHYDPDNAEKWLRVLARHLVRMSDLGRSAVDVHVYELWRTTGMPPHLGRRVRLQAAAIIGGIPTIAFMLIFWCAAIYNSQFRDGQVIAFAAVFNVIFFAAGLLMENQSDPKPPDRLAISGLGDRAGRRRLVEGLAIALAVGALAGLLFGIVAGFAFAVLFLFMASVRVQFDEPNQAATRPSGPLGQAIVRDITVGAVAALTVGVALALSPTLNVVPAFVAVLAVGLMFGGGLGTSLWPHYVLATRRLGLPFRLGRFLDWAYGAGLVRLAGTATQFRHRELQDRLARTY